MMRLDFPREVLDMSALGKGWRRIVQSKEDLSKYWAARNGSSNVYMTVYGYQRTTPPYHKRCDYSTVIVPHFVMDFDAQKRVNREMVAVPLEEVQEEVIRLHDFLCEERIRHRMWFSGGGYHIWVALDKTYTASSTSDCQAIKRAGLSVVRKWREDLNLTTLDTGVSFDLQRLIRIPNSFNSKRERWMVPLDEIFLLVPIEDLLIESEEPHQGFHEFGNTGVTLDLKYEQEMPATSWEGEIGKVGDTTLLPCLRTNVCDAINPPHLPRAYLVQFLAHRLRMFMPRNAISKEQSGEIVENICSLISKLGWADFDERTTRGHVEHIVSNYDFSPSCATLTAHDLCVGKCPFYDGT